MRVLIIALIAAISYAQTEEPKEEEKAKMWYEDYDIAEEDIVELPGSCNGVRSLLYKPQSEWGPEDEPYQLTILESFRTLGRCEFASTYVGEPEGTITGWLEIRELPDCKAMIEYAPDCVEAFMSEETVEVSCGFSKIATLTWNSDLSHTSRSLRTTTLELGVTTNTNTITMAFQRRNASTSQLTMMPVNTECAQLLILDLAMFPVRLEVTNRRLSKSLEISTCTTNQIT